MCYDEEYFLERNLYPWLDDPPDPSEIDEYPREFAHEAFCENCNCVLTEDESGGDTCPECGQLY